MVLTLKPVVLCARQNFLSNPTICSCCGVTHTSRGGNESATKHVLTTFRATPSHDGSRHNEQILA
eukprot:6296812-Amphidinium_carterae.1